MVGRFHSSIHDMGGGKNLKKPRMIRRKDPNQFFSIALIYIEVIFINV